MPEGASPPGMEPIRAATVFFVCSLLIIPESVSLFSSHSDIASKKAEIHLKRWTFSLPARGPLESLLELESSAKVNFLFSFSSR